MWIDALHSPVFSAAAASNDSLAVAALFLGPLSAIVVAAVTAYVSRKNGRGSTTVAHKEASTHEFAALTEGFVSQLTFFQTELDTTRKRLDQHSARIQVLEKENRVLNEHIGVLEDLIPYPPGPPTRPLDMR